MASKVSTLVSTKWLFEQISRGMNNNLQVLDSSWYLPKAKRDPLKEYKERHIPGSLFYDIEENSDNTSPYSHTLPSPDEFSKYIGKLGVGSDTHVVVYDGSEQAGFFSAPRLWFLLRVFGHQQVSVLNGGLQKWISDGYELTDKIPEVDEAQFQAKFHSEKVKSFEEMDANITEKKYQVMDARSKGRFDGTAPEPRSDCKSGHIPNSISLPFPSIIDMENKCMRSPEEIQKIFDDSGIDLSKPLAASCGAGISACVLILGAHMAGKDDVYLFDGSWVEYYKRAKPENIHTLDTPLG
ncbi:3-mercaptopyruvate sulfurtransferase-like [Anneissia japonica]|uniref:3-mercaptopyruvate sulfurtransferase-like n=1 Tax=Anneissia japonica TaxID=1529436 RepID=UPI001425A8A8|nr:3-mercaptopyruvate sulfurtransferase-like [Anneissia japonica]